MSATNVPQFAVSRIESITTSMDEPCECIPHNKNKNLGKVPHCILSQRERASEMARMMRLNAQVDKAKYSKFFAALGNEPCVPMRDCERAYFQQLGLELGDE